jgi:hypothetical protein
MPAVLLLGEAIAVAVRYEMPDFLLVVVFDAVAAVVVTWQWPADGQTRLRALPWLPVLVGVGVAVTYVPRLIVGMWIEGG